MLTVAQFARGFIVVEKLTAFCL